MGSYLRNTVWYVDFKIKNKRYRLRTDAKSKKEADGLVILEKTKKINELSKSKSDIIFSEALTYFLKEYCARALKPKTTERYKTSSKMLNPYFKDMPLSKISKLDISTDVIEVSGNTINELISMMGVEVVCNLTQAICLFPLILFNENFF